MSVKPLALTILLLAVAACSATGQLKVAKPKDAAIRPAASVAIQVGAKPGAADDQQDTAQAVSLLRQDLVGKLPGTGLFGRVVDADASPDYTLQVTLQEIRWLPGAARWAAGLHGAVNRLAADVALQDNASGAPLTSYSAEVEGAKFWLASESSFEGTMDQLGNRVIEGLR